MEEEKMPEQQAAPMADKKKNDRKWADVLGYIGLGLFVFSGVVAIIPFVGFFVGLFLAPIWFVFMVLGFFGPRKIGSIITLVLFLVGLVVMLVANVASSSIG